MSHGVVIPDEEVFIAHKHRKEMAKEGDDGKNTFKLRTTTPREFTIVRRKIGNSNNSFYGELL